MHDRKQLYVLRHAKSSWEEPELHDHDRSLAPRGRNAVKALAGYVRQKGIKPALVVCSSARRTRETLDGVDPGGEQLIEPQLYSASAEELLARLRQVPDETESVMVVGHNPALQILVLRLADTGDAPAEDSDLEAIRHKFPTGGLATLSFEGGWSGLAFGGAELVELVRPRQLL
jgi:phosphohistidine phosphatase